MNDETKPIDYRKIEGTIHAWWPRKTQAIVAAAFIGWRAKDVGRVHTRFASGWGIRDNDGSWMTDTRYKSLCVGRVK